MTRLWRYLRVPVIYLMGLESAQAMSRCLPSPHPNPDCISPLTFYLVVVLPLGILISVLVHWGILRLVRKVWIRVLLLLPLNVAWLLGMGVLLLWMTIFTCGCR